MLGGLCGFGRLVVSRVMGTGLIIAGGDCVSGLEWQFWGLAGGAVLMRGAGSLRGPGVVAAGSGMDFRAALAWLVVLGLGPGV